MKRYNYKAKDKTGKVYTGEVEAASEKTALKLLHERNLIVISIKPVGGFSLGFVKKIRGRISKGDVTSFTRQMSTMINAGLPLTEALLILRAQAKPSMQTVISQVLNDVEEGNAFSKSLEKHPRVFTRTYVALIRSGEVGGVLDSVMARLADNLEKQQEFSGKVKSAMIYPIIIIIGMTGVALIMLVFVVPRLTSLYDQFDADLPVTTKLLIAISNFMVKLWPLVLIGAFGLIYGFKLYRKSNIGRNKTDRLLLRLPMIGELQMNIILADLTRTLGLMVSSGVSIIEGLIIASEVVGNIVVSNALKDTADMVEKGFPIAYSFSKRSDVFPLILSQMIAVGEETGKMDEVLDKVSHVFEVDSDQKLKNMTAAVEPIILIVLGVGVAFLVISIIMPIYNLTTQL